MSHQDLIPLIGIPVSDHGLPPLIRIDWLVLRMNSYSFYKSSCIVVEPQLLQLIVVEEMHKTLAHLMHFVWSYHFQNYEV